MTSASLIHEAGQSKPVLWDNAEGWGGEGGGNGVQEGGHMYTRHWFMLYAKNHHNTVQESTSN